MQEAVNYQIFQRKNGSAHIPFGGDVPADFQEENAVFARVIREDDSLTVVPWTHCSVENGHWHVEMDVPEGGLYRMEAVRAGHADVALQTLLWCHRIKHVKHFGVGELYMITGQSNMAGYGRDLAFDPPTLGVHLYGNNGQWDIATHPTNDSVDSIYPENVELTSAASPVLSFGRMMMQRLGVPVGLVQASLGGSPLSAWHPEEDGKLYRAMLRRLPVTGPVGGILWYQGCSDTHDENNAKNYLARFTRMIELWRKELGNIPVITVQLNRKATLPDEHERDWGRVVEAQRMAAKTIPNLCVVPSLDMTTTDGIHNSAASNVVIGERMAQAALCTFYGKTGLCAPSVESVKRVNDTQIKVFFPKEYKVMAMDNQGRGLHVEDADGLIECPTVVSIEGGLLITTKRPFSMPAQFHAYWQYGAPDFFIRDMHGMPILACYGVPVKT